MKKVFLDTNVIIDLVLEREGADAAEGLHMALPKVLTAMWCNKRL